MRERLGRLRDYALYLVLCTAMMMGLLAPFQVARAGGPKCDRKDSERCTKCAGMNHMNCQNRCHRGCCGCPDGSDPAEGKCSRDEYQGDPEQGGEPEALKMGFGD